MEVEMSLWIGLEIVLLNLLSLTAVVLVGQESGLDFTKTLHFPRALGMLNSTIRPKPSCNDSVARVYSASAIGYSLC